MAISIEQAQALITDKVVERYRCDGYWVTPPLFDASDLARLRAAHDRLWRGDYDHEIVPQYGITPVDRNSPRVRQQCNAFWLLDDIRWAVTHPVIGYIASRFMAVPGVKLWHDQAVLKPAATTSAADGNSIGWHQDRGYWRATSTDNMCTAWIALQHTGLANGGMRTLAGSHRWNVLIDKSELSFWDQDMSLAQKRFGTVRDEPCIIEAGAVSFHHALTLHGSGPNLSSEPRLSLISHMMPGDTCYRAGQQQHPNLVFLGPQARDGQSFDGPYWPTLWPAPSQASSPA